MHYGRDVLDFHNNLRPMAALLTRGLYALAYTCRNPVPESMMNHEREPSSPIILSCATRDSISCAQVQFQIEVFAGVVLVGLAKALRTTRIHPGKSPPGEGQAC